MAPRRAMGAHRAAGATGGDEDLHGPEVPGTWHVVPNRGEGALRRAVRDDVSHAEPRTRAETTVDRRWILVRRPNRPRHLRAQQPPRDQDGSRPSAAKRDHRKA